MYTVQFQGRQRRHVVIRSDTSGGCFFHHSESAFERRKMLKCCGCNHQWHAQTQNKYGKLWTFFFRYYQTVLINGARASFRRDTHIYSKQTRSKREQGGYPWIHERHAMKSLSANRVVVFLFFGAYWNVCNTEDDAVIRSEPLQYCPYFKNRGPSRQENLGNCSWYKESSCCYDEEIEFAFRQLTPLIGASGDCLKYLNYLYCYICAPNQNTFFKDFTLTVCREFCDRVYDSCKNAVLKGRKIKYIYKNGEQFCKGRRFETDMEANGKCFTFEPRPTVKSGSQRTHFCMGFVVFALFGKRCVLLWSKSHESQPHHVSGRPGRLDNPSIFVVHFTTKLKV